MKKISDHIRKAVSHPLARGSAIVFAGTMVANAGSYLYHLVVGRILGPVGYGELAALLSLSYILNVFAVMLQTVVTKFVAEKTAQDKPGDIRALVIRLSVVLLVVGALCTGLLLFLAGPIAAFLNIRDSVVIFYLFIGIVFTLIGMVYASVLQGMQRFTAGMVILNVTSLFRLAGGAAFAAFGVTATLAANMGAIFLATLVAFWTIRTVVFTKKQATSFALSPLFKTSAATFFAVLGISVLNSQDVVMVKHFLPAVQSGWYGALATMGKIIFFASSAVAYVLLPIVSDRSARGSKTGSLVYMSVGAVALLSFGITAGFFILPRLALGLLYGSAFVVAAPYLGMFGIFSSLYTVCYTIVMALLGMGKSAVWAILIFIAMLQDVLLAMFHNGIWPVIHVNIGISVLLVAALLVYYRHATSEH